MYTINRNGLHSLPCEFAVQVLVGVSLWSLCVCREVGKLQKKAVIIQSSLEQKRLEKHNVLLDCKVQDIDIVLLLGSLDDIIDVEVLRRRSQGTTA